MSKTEELKVKAEAFNECLKGMCLQDYYKKAKPEDQRKIKRSIQNTMNYRMLLLTYAFREAGKSIKEVLMANQ